MKVIKNVFNKLERSHKNIQIRSSGSTPGAKLEKIRSGQSYLYQKNGMESEVFEITFHKKISGSMLNQALTETVKRYPYLNTKLVELDGDFYIIQNEMHLTAKRTQTLARLGHISCGYHLVDVTYFGKSVYISWHHALCDGKGIKPFVETLIYYYCKLRYRSKADSNGIRLANSPLLPDETTEPNLGSYTFDESKEPVNVSRDAYQIPENIIEEHETDYRYDIQIPAAAFMKVCKETGATPVILTSLLVSRGIAKLYPDFDKSINANIAVDIRDALDLPNTFKNCVRSMPLPFEREFLNMTLTQQAEKQRALLTAQRDRDSLRRAANASLGLFDKLDSQPDYKAKQGMMDFFNGMLLNTYIISYLGQMNVGDNARYIDTVGFYNSGAAGLGVNILSCGDKFCFNFKQSFESDKYVKAFLAELDELGVEYKSGGAIPFLTPNDAIIKRK
ncbi:MAG: hypothetical protein IJ017_05450 [Oscillospiraceae bacterium]|nr:hypothetical protein [Oscillospiraceae bacterium]